ncbi:Coiled-coil and C2 domain-containing protein 1A [Bagarius yarrelli]|uniref:Coiled-coil and C2 domain-containing protein 1A n=1 Tax=Bagarius yarrelli TaxID=175774 RepID=A0A556TL71_BAGYA|nr:Coiled-coil and C2 domain-containing protein 1A [Bagarius yarrelli]
MSRSRNPPQKGQGAARAKQLGLVLDLSPDAALEDSGGNEELEAELLTLIGGGGGRGKPPGKKEGGKAPVPMEDIERMAALCMKDLDEEGDDDTDLENDAELLAELNEVLEDDQEKPAPHAPIPPQRSNATPKSTPSTPSGAGGLESRLQERIDMYQTAIASAKASGESSKARRYERGLKTLQSMLMSVKKGKSINEEEIPPPVSTGARPTSTQQEPGREQEQPALEFTQFPKTNEKPLQEIKPVTPPKPQLLQPPNQKTPVKLDSVVEAIDRGEYVDTSSLPHPPGAIASPSPPQSAPAKPTPAPPPADAEAPESAKSKGDDRKARMHQRIAKQYQDAIKAHKAGRPVNLAELPVPPGCPPLQGFESTEQNFLGVLETAVKLANQDADAEEEDEPEEIVKPTVRPSAQKARVPAHSHSSSPAVTPSASTETPKLAPKAQQQLDFLLRRRQQFVKAALRSKQMKDVQGAAQHLRNAKGLDVMITAAKGGLPVDISKVPSAPLSEEDYALPNTRSSRTSQQYAQLMEHLRQQHEKCLSYLQQFTQMGNLAETLSNIELVKKAHAKGYPVPSHHTEERTINTVKIFPNLTATEMELTIVKGINLPTPGFSASDLDASVRFEFPFPTAEEAQRDKTNTVRGTNSPEFRAYFKLHINRTHRGFKRVVQTKGMKFEIVHKGLLPPQYKLHSFSLLNYDKERLERMEAAKDALGRLKMVETEVS